jgi:hypothetical protein
MFWPSDIPAFLLSFIDNPSEAIQGAAIISYFVICFLAICAVVAPVVYLIGKGDKK